MNDSELCSWTNKNIALKTNRYEAWIENEWKSRQCQKNKNNLKDLQRTQDHVTNDKKVCSMETKQKEIMDTEQHKINI